MSARTPVQIAAEMEWVQAQVQAGRLAEAAGRTAIERLTAELVASAGSRRVVTASAGELDRSQGPVAAGSHVAPRQPTDLGVVPPARGGSVERLFRNERLQLEELGAAVAPAPPVRPSATPAVGAPREGPWERGSAAPVQAASESAGALQTRTGGIRSPEIDTLASPWQAAPIGGAVAAGSGESGSLPVAIRFSPLQVGVATFLGCCFAGSLLIAANAFDDRKPVAVVIRLLAVVLFLPVYLWATGLRGAEFGVGYVVVCGVFAILFSQVDGRPSVAKPWWQVAIAVVVGMLGWSLTARPILWAIQDALAVESSPPGLDGEVGGGQGKYASEELRAYPGAPAELAAPGIASEERADELAPDCLPQYVGACVPPWPPDVNCKDISGPVRVVGRDVHKLDRDGDGRACEGRSR